MTGLGFLLLAVVSVLAVSATVAGLILADEVDRLRATVRVLEEAPRYAAVLETVNGSAVFDEAPMRVLSLN